MLSGFLRPRLHATRESQRQQKLQRALDAGYGRIYHYLLPWWVSAHLTPRTCVINHIKSTGGSRCSFFSAPYALMQPLVLHAPL